MLDRNSFVPLYRQLSDEILEKIDSGVIRPGDKLPSENEMIEEYGIGRPTVRMALSELVNQGYLSKERGKGTFCTSKTVARPSSNINLILDMDERFFFPIYMKSISEVLYDHNYKFVVSNSRNSSIEISKCLNDILEQGTSGVILQPSRIDEPAPKELKNILKKYRQSGIPYIMIDSNYDDIESSYIILNEHKGGGIVAEYLHSLGHTNILIVCYNKSKEYLCRINGYETVCRKSGYLEPKCLFYTESSFNEDLISIIKENSITALFCCDDIIALRCINVLREKGYMIPDDISVIGFDDSVGVSKSFFPLTTLAHPKQAMGDLATNVLIEHINKTRPWPYHYVFTPSILERESCRSIK